MMRGAPALVTVVLLCVLVLTVQAGTVRIRECIIGSVTQDENSTPAHLTCDGFTDTDTVTWTVANQNTSRATVIRCPPQNTTCYSADRDLIVSRTGQESSLRIHGNYRLREGEDGITCSAANQKASCTFNVTTKARLSKCDVKLNAADWTVSGRCRFEKAYSSNGLYTCTWHQDQPVTTIPGVVDKIAIDKPWGVYYNGNCTFMTSLSPHQGERRYSYSVTFVPGPDDRPAARPITIQSPGDPVTNCPQYVYEGQSVSCDCLVNSPGYPPATAQWKDKRPGHPLVVHDVTRNDSDRVFTCSLTWGPANDSIKKETHYKLDVAYPPPFLPVISGYNDRSVVTAGNPLNLTCTVTGGRPLVTSVNVSCGPDVQGDVSPMNVTNTSVSVTFTIDSIEARHDGTECVCTGYWEFHREAYNVSASIQLRVTDVDVFPWPIVAGAIGGSVGVLLIIAVVVVIFKVRKRQQQQNSDNTTEEQDTESTYDSLRQSDIGQLSIYSVVNHGRISVEVDHDTESTYDSLRQSDVGQRTIYSAINPERNISEVENGKNPA